MLNSLSMESPSSARENVVRCADFSFPRREDAVKSLTFIGYTPNNVSLLYCSICNWHHQLKKTQFSPFLNPNAQIFKYFIFLCACSWKGLATGYMYKFNVTAKIWRTLNYSLQMFISELCRAWQSGTLDRYCI